MQKSWNVWLISAVVVVASLVWNPSIVNLTKMKMPDLSRLEAVSFRPVTCPATGMIGRQGLNEPGSDPSLNEAVAWYSTPEAAKSRRPFLVVLFQTDIPNGLIRIYVDLDLNGRVDISGMPGDPGLGSGVCDVVGRVRTSSTTAPVIVPEKNRKVIM